MFDPFRDLVYKLFWYRMQSMESVMITSSRVRGACQDKSPSRDSQAAWLSE